MGMGNALLKARRENDRLTPHPMLYLGDTSGPQCIYIH